MALTEVEKGFKIRGSCSWPREHHSGSSLRYEGKICFRGKSVPEFLISDGGVKLSWVWRNEILLKNMSNYMDVEELRRQIDSGELKLVGSSRCIESGKLSNRENVAVKYEINHGWDILSANSCDRQWALFNVKLFEYIQRQGYSEEELAAVLSNVKFEHLHWDWFRKSVCYTIEGYEWFYMFAEGEPQGACLIYHPKDSIIDSENIFYIEFIEVAPWNRNNPMGKRRFKGIGSLMIKCVLCFAVKELKLRPGFSLHSLPQAVGYYEKIGMEKYNERDKESLVYFEMPRAKAMEILGAE